MEAISDRSSRATAKRRPPVREDRPATVTAPVRPAARTVSPQACATCGTAPAANGGAAAAASLHLCHWQNRSPLSHVSRWKRNSPRPPAGPRRQGLTDRQALQKVLSQRQNRYLARQLCWVMTIEGLETYILVPRDPADLDLLVEALRAYPQSDGPGLRNRRARAPSRRPRCATD